MPLGRTRSYDRSRWLERCARGRARRRRFRRPGSCGNFEVIAPSTAGMTRSTASSNTDERRVAAELEDETFFTECPALRHEDLADLRWNGVKRENPLDAADRVVRRELASRRSAAEPVGHRCSARRSARLARDLQGGRRAQPAASVRQKRREVCDSQAVRDDQFEDRPFQRGPQPLRVIIAIGKFQGVMLSAQRRRWLNGLVDDEALVAGVSEGNTSAPRFNSSLEVPRRTIRGTLRT